MRTLEKLQKPEPRTAHSRRGRRRGGRRSTRNSRRYWCPARVRKATCGSKVSDKLHTLRSLLPSCSEGVDGDNDDQMVKTEQLFQETADYIIRLRTQVVLLQKLIDLYGSAASDPDHQRDDVVL